MLPQGRILQTRRTILLIQGIEKIGNFLSSRENLLVHGLKLSRSISVIDGVRDVHGNTGLGVLSEFKIELKHNFVCDVDYRTLDCGRTVRAELKTAIDLLLLPSSNATVLLVSEDDIHEPDRALSLFHVHGRDQRNLHIGDGIFRLTSVNINSILNGVYIKCNNGLRKSRVAANLATGTAEASSQVHRKGF